MSDLAARADLVSERYEAVPAPVRIPSTEIHRP